MSQTNVPATLPEEIVNVVGLPPEGTETFGVSKAGANNTSLRVQEDNADGVGIREWPLARLAEGVEWLRDLAGPGDYRVIWFRSSTGKDRMAGRGRSFSLQKVHAAPTPAAAPAPEAANPLSFLGPQFIAAMQMNELMSARASRDVEMLVRLAGLNQAHAAPAGLTAADLRLAMRDQAEAMGAALSRTLDPLIARITRLEARDATPAPAATPGAGAVAAVARAAPRVRADAPIGESLKTIFLNYMQDNPEVVAAAVPAVLGVVAKAAEAAKPKPQARLRGAVVDTTAEVQAPQPPPPPAAPPPPGLNAHAASQPAPSPAAPQGPGLNTMAAAPPATGAK